MNALGGAADTVLKSTKTRQRCDMFTVTGDKNRYETIYI